MVNKISFIFVSFSGYLYMNIFIGKGKEMNWGFDKLSFFVPLLLIDGTG